MVTLGRMKSTVDEDVVAVISGTDVKESILGLESSCQHLPGLTAGDSSQSFGLPFLEIRPAECYPVETPENHRGELATETLTGKHTITVWRDMLLNQKKAIMCIAPQGSQFENCK